MSGDRILVIEDDPTMRQVLKDNLEYSGFRVTLAEDGEQGIDAAIRHRPQLILLDLMLPKVNGYEVCRHLRKAELEMPIIMLTAKGEEEDVVLGLNLGADDYVTKPFSVKELMARVQAFLRRHGTEQVATFSFGPFTLDLETHRLQRDGEEIVLTPKEFGLLAFFARNPGRALTRDAVLRAVWGDDLMVTRRSVDRCVNTLRGKIEDDPANPTWIATIRDVGYRFSGN